LALRRIKYLRIVLASKISPLASQKEKMKVAASVTLLLLLLLLLLRGVGCGLVGCNGTHVAASEQSHHPYERMIIHHV
jgi:hypothetical protein